MTVEVIRAACFGVIPHGFLGRRGGVSKGIHAGLNVGRGSDDDPVAVAANRALATAAVLPEAALQTLYQIHSADAVTILAPLDKAVRPRGDALVTDRPGLLLGILTADCAPVLFADAQAGVIGAAHAGWKGALGGITDSTMLAMEALGAQRGRIVAAIGPCISQASYEVDDAFADRFEVAAAGNALFFRAGRVGRRQFDLEGYVAARLRSAGVGTVVPLGLDTYPNADRFFSYRRATHRAEPDYGRQISVIGLP